jgi:hypothetical protein
VKKAARANDAASGVPQEDVFSRLAFFLRQGAPRKVTQGPRRPFGEAPPNLQTLRAAPLADVIKGKKLRRPPKAMDHKAFRSLVELSAYLSKFSFSMETRYLSGASGGIVYLRDLLLDVAAPAFFVSRVFHPKRLSALSSKKTQQKKRAPVSPMAAVYRDALRISHNGRPPSYAGWLGIRTGLPSSLSRKVNLAYVVSNNIGYIGRPGQDAHSPLECLSGREQTVKRLYDYLATLATKTGSTPPSLETFLSLPNSEQDAFLRKYFVFDENMTPRTPVLFRDAYLVRAVDVSPLLAARHLTAVYGETLSEFCSKIEKKSNRKNRDEMTFLSSIGPGLTAAPARYDSPSAKFGGA